MENYSKGKNVEEPLSKDNIPIPDLPINFIWMQVSGGSKMRNLLGYAIKTFKEERAIIWSASGAAMGKAISCVEIMKRHFRQAHQITKICYRKVEEYWEPLLEDLDPLVVLRQLPTIHILLSKDPLNTAEPGYQAPGTFHATKAKDYGNEKSKYSGNQRKHRQSNLTPEEFSALGLRTGSSRKSFGKSKQNSERTAPSEIPEPSKNEDKNNDATSS